MAVTYGNQITLCRASHRILAENGQSIEASLYTCLVNFLHLNHVCAKYQEKINIWCHHITAIGQIWLNYVMLNNQIS